MKCLSLDRIPIALFSLLESWARGGSNLGFCQCKYQGI